MIVLCLVDVDDEYWVFCVFDNVFGDVFEWCEFVVIGLFVGFYYDYVGVVFVGVVEDDLMGNVVLNCCCCWCFFFVFFGVLFDCIDCVVVEWLDDGVLLVVVCGEVYLLVDDW